MFYEKENMHFIISNISGDEKDRWWMTSRANSTVSEGLVISWFGCIFTVFALWQIVSYTMTLSAFLCLVHVNNILPKAILLRTHSDVQIGSQNMKLP